MFQDFISQYFSQSGYNLVNTTVYAFAVIVAVYLIYEILKKLKIPMNSYFALALSPYVVFGGILRVLRDVGYSNSFWLVTPGIYIFVFLITFLTLLVAWGVDRKFKIPYYKLVFIFGLLLASVAFSFINIRNFYGLFLAIVIFLPFATIFKFAIKWSKENKIVTLVQIFDSTTTFTAIQFFGYLEQHVVPRFFIGLFSPVSFIILKIFTAVLALVLIDKFSKDKEFNWYLKVIIAILGGATATRDLTCLASLCTPH